MSARPIEALPAARALMPTQAVVLDVGGVLAHNMWEPMFDDLAADHALDRAKVRTRLVICSNNNEIWWPRQSQALELDRFFTPENVILSSRIGAPKESPRLEMFQAAVAAAGVPAPSCFFVDDRQPIVARAQAFGLDAMLFRGPEHFAAELRKRALL